MKKGRFRRLSERAGLENVNAEADPPRSRGRLPATSTASGRERKWPVVSAGYWRQRACTREWMQHGKPCRWRARANRQFRSDRRRAVRSDQAWAETRSLGGFWESTPSVPPSHASTATLLPNARRLHVLVARIAYATVANRQVRVAHFRSLRSMNRNSHRAGRDAGWWCATGT